MRIKILEIDCQYTVRAVDWEIGLGCLLKMLCKEWSINKMNKFEAGFLFQILLKMRS
ncbi:MAG: Unknown protein, partial [uncultured Aureispira sp.]